MSVPNQRKQNNDRKWYAQHPKQNSATHFVLPFLCDLSTCGGRFGSEAFRLKRANPPRPEPRRIHQRSADFVVPRWTEPPCGDPLPLSNRFYLLFVHINRQWHPRPRPRPRRVASNVIRRATSHRKLADGGYILLQMCWIGVRKIETATDPVRRPCLPRGIARGI
jgi:hypothetical protein